MLEESPDQVEAYRRGLKADRKDRQELASRTTEALLARMDAAVGTANAKVLLHPSSSRAVVGSSNHVAAGVLDFHGLVRIESDHQLPEVRRWRAAASEAKDKALENAGPAVAVIAAGTVTVALKVAGAGEVEAERGLPSSAAWALNAV